MSEKMQKIAQRKFIKGVSASPQDFTQPDGTIPRASNFIYDRRGALDSCDGTQFISHMNFRPDGPQPGTSGLGFITETFLYEPIGIANAYYGIRKSPNLRLGFPTGLAAVDGGAGLLSAGTYQWVVTALDGAGGETAQSVSVSLVLAASHKANLTWTTTPFATGYNVYRTVANGSTFLLVNGSTPITTNSYNDNIPDANLGTIQAPTSDTTQTSAFFQFTQPSYLYGTIVKQFPADYPPVKDDTGGGFGGGKIGGGTSGQQPPTPAGGVAGNLSPIPQIVQFNNLMILALGNGFPPYQSDGTTGNTVALNNTFTASYPAHANSNPQAQGDLITVTVGGTAYVYKAIQGGTTAAAPPAFPAGINVTVADGSVIWQNIGVVGTNPAPRGAAHEIVYAGSLWIFNTSPTNTTDNFDGPSCLKMSDTNNQNSWNPLNVAFLDKDDGTQGMGLAVFTIAEAGIAPTGSLVAFKEFSTFQIIGVFGASDFSIQRAQTDMGCVAPRTISFVPGFGIARLTHLGFAVFDGVRDRLISEEIRPYIFGGLPDIQPVDWNYVYFSKAAQTAQPPMYSCAVPLVPPSTIGSFPNITSVTAANGGSIPSGTYYVTLYMQTVQGNFFQSVEFGPITLSGIQASFHLLFSSFPSNIFQIYLAYGPTPGGENMVSPITSDALGLNMFWGVAGFPSSGPPFTSGGLLSRLFCFDLVLKAWAVIDLPFPISTLKQYRSIGTIPITTMTGSTDGVLRRWQAGDTTWDAGATNAGAPDQNIRYNFRTAEVFGRNASDRVFFRRIGIRGKGDPTGLSVTYSTNGVQGTTTATATFNTQIFGNGEFAAYADLAITCLDTYAVINGVTGLGCEIDSVDWFYMPKPMGAVVFAG